AYDIEPGLEFIRVLFRSTGEPGRGGPPPARAGGDARPAAAVVPGAGGPHDAGASRASRPHAPGASGTDLRRPVLSGQEASRATRSEERRVGKVPGGMYGR